MYLNIIQHYLYIIGIMQYDTSLSLQVLYIPRVLQINLFKQTNSVGWFMVFNAIFNNIWVISWRSVSLVEETGENHRPYDHDNDGPSNEFEKFVWICSWVKHIYSVNVL